MPSNTDTAADLFIGAGKVYIDLLDSNLARTGERYVGNATSFALSNADEVRSKYSSSEATRPLLDQANVRRSPEFVLSMDEHSQENLELFAMGDRTDFTQSSDTSASYVPPTQQVKQGYWIPILDTNGDHVRGTIASPLTNYGVTSHTETTDFIFDLVGGRVYIVPGGGIADAASITITWDQPAIAAGDLPFVRGGVSNFLKAFVRYVGDPSKGKIKEVEIWQASLTPDGELSLIGDDYGAIGIRGAVLADTAGHPTEPYFRVYERAA